VTRAHCCRDHKSGLKVRDGHEVRLWYMGKVFGNDRVWIAQHNNNNIIITFLFEYQYQTLYNNNINTLWHYRIIWGRWRWRRTGVVRNDYYDGALIQLFDSDCKVLLRGRRWVSNVFFSSDKQFTDSRCHKKYLRFSSKRSG